MFLIFLMDQFLRNFFIGEINSELRPCGQLSAQIDVINKAGKRLSVLGCAVVEPAILQEKNIDADEYTALAFPTQPEKGCYNLKKTD